VLFLAGVLLSSGRAIRDARPVCAACGTATTILRHDDAVTTDQTRILLVGMMGAGKSTVGRELARRTGWPFLDNDALVRELTGREPAAIDAEDGEDALHDAEIAAFHAAIDRSGPAIVAIAGTIVDRPEELERLATAGHVVWLRGRPGTLRARIGSGQGRRADAVDIGWIRARVARREPAYRAAASQVIDIEDHAPRQIAGEILRSIGWAAPADQPDSDGSAS
jgi:shikimate kinase